MSEVSCPVHPGEKFIPRKCSECPVEFTFTLTSTTLVDGQCEECKGKCACGECNHKQSFVD